MISNLIAEIPSLAVESFVSTNIFYLHVWYGRECIEVESLYIYHSVDYPDYGAEITHIYISTIYRIHMNIVDV